MASQTYKITFSLLTPMAFIDLPTFDGILSYAYARDIMRNNKSGFQQKLNYEPDELIDFSGMPICKHTNGYFISSSMFYTDFEIIEDTQRWRKRWDCKHDNIADFGKNKKKVDISRGVFKSYDMPLSTKLIEKCFFYFQTDNIKDVERLVFKWIHFLGKKRAQGYGEIKHFKIENCDFNFDLIYRPIPTKFIDTTNITGKIELKYCAWRPPYWLPENFDTCAIYSQ